MSDQSFPPTPSGAEGSSDAPTSPVVSPTRSVIDLSSADGSLLRVVPAGADPAGDAIADAPRVLHRAVGPLALVAFIPVARAATK